MKFVDKGFILLLLFTCSSMLAQETKTTRDIGLWMGLGMDYKVNKKWTASAELELRTFDNAVRLSKPLLDLGLSYKLSKVFKLKGGLRYAYNREGDQTFTHNIRYNVDFSGKRELTDKLNLRYRFRYQNNYESPFTGFSNYEVRGNVRNRLELEREFDKHEVYFSAEVFRQFNYYRKPFYSLIRLRLGDEVETEIGEFDFGLYYERELNEDKPLNFFFLRINYTFEFKHG